MICFIITQKKGILKKRLIITEIHWELIEMKTKYRIRKMKTDREKHGGTPVYAVERKNEKSDWEHLYSSNKESCKNYVNYLKIEKFKEHGNWQDTKR